jgi:undecaprenyl-diphosphatase
MVSITLLVTGTFLMATRFLKTGRQPIDLKRALGIGIVQAFALIPGISRSGSTISAALAMGIKQEEAARFSFIMVLPLIVAATLLEIKDLLATGISSDQGIILLMGLVTSFIIGYVSLKWLLQLLRNGKFHLFAWYCYAVGIAGLIYF